MDLSILGSCCWFFFVARIQQLSFCSFSFSCLSSCCQIRFVLSPIPARLIRSCSGALSPTFLRFLRRLQCLAKEFAVFSPFRLVSSARSARPGAPAGFCSREQDAGEDFLRVFPARPRSRSRCTAVSFLRFWRRFSVPAPDCVCRPSSPCLICFSWPDLVWAVPRLVVLVSDSSTQQISARSGRRFLGFLILIFTACFLFLPRRRVRSFLRARFSLVPSQIRFPRCSSSRARQWSLHLDFICHRS